MAGQSEKTKEVKLRMPNKEYYLVEAYAVENGINRSQAIISLIRKGLEKDSELPASSAEISALRAELQTSFAAVAKAIENQPINVQLPQPEKPALEAPQEKRAWWQFWK